MTELNIIYTGMYDITEPKRNLLHDEVTSDCMCQEVQESIEKCDAWIHVHLLEGTKIVQCKKNRYGPPARFNLIM